MAGAVLIGGVQACRGVKNKDLKSGNRYFQLVYFCTVARCDGSEV